MTDSIYVELTGTYAKFVRDAAAASETDISTVVGCIIQREIERGVKRGIATDVIRKRVAQMHPDRIITAEVLYQLLTE